MIINNTYKTFDYTVILPENIQYSCLWLHGYKERSCDILRQSHLEELAKQYHTAIILPDVADSYYINQPWNNLYIEDYLIKEFIPFIQTNYQLFSNKASSFIGGISMGGFGSLLIGSHSNLFSKIICISSAFILHDITNGNPEIVGYHNEKHFRNLFGDFISLRTSYERNPLVAAQVALQNTQLPSIFMACGTEDLLFERNRNIYHTLVSSNADVTWFEAKGNHNYSFFNQAIVTSFQWALKRRNDFIKNSI